MDSLLTKRNLQQSSPWTISLVLFVGGMLLRHTTSIPLSEDNSSWLWTFQIPTIFSFVGLINHNYEEKATNLEEACRCLFRSASSGLTFAMVLTYFFWPMIKWILTPESTSSWHEMFGELRGLPPYTHVMALIIGSLLAIPVVSFWAFLCSCSLTWAMYDSDVVRRFAQQQQQNERIARSPNSDTNLDTSSGTSSGTSSDTNSDTNSEEF